MFRLRIISDDRILERKSRWLQTGIQRLILDCAPYNENLFKSRPNGMRRRAKFKRKLTPEWARYFEADPSKSAREKLIGHIGTVVATNNERTQYANNKAFSRRCKYAESAGKKVRNRISRKRHAILWPAMKRSNAKLQQGLCTSNFKVEQTLL